MTVSVLAKSASMNILQRPNISTPYVNGDDMFFRCSSPLRLAGECQIDGDVKKGDNPAGWTLGIIQIEWIETNWAIYRGQYNADGSCFLQRARPPARPVQGCRDTRNPGGIFYDFQTDNVTVAAAGQPFPVQMTVGFKDGPGDAYPLKRLNSQTGKDNYLWKAQLEYHFCTVLSLRNPNASRYIHLKHLLWYLHWQVKFQPTNFSNLGAQWTITPDGGAGANGGHVGGLYDGGPTDTKFISILTVPGVANCNGLAQTAASAPNTRESSEWSGFNVTR